MKGFTRPEATVLPEDAMIPDKNLIKPAPNQFTHKLKSAQAYYYDGAQQGAPADGEFPAGTKVALLVHDGGNYCRVVDARGLYVEIEFASLKKL